MRLEPGSREDRVLTLGVALQYPIAPGRLHGIAARRHPLPGEVEDLDARIAAAAILDAWRSPGGTRCGGQVRLPEHQHAALRRPGRTSTLARKRLLREQLFARTRVRSTGHPVETPP
jgi:hypothetical protein